MARGNRPEVYNLLYKPPTPLVPRHLRFEARMRAYLGELEGRLADESFGGRLNVIQSTGGMISTAAARELPIRTLESGPAGGMIGALTLGHVVAVRHLIAADVGGTSFDVGLVYEAGVVNQQLMDFIAANNRFPEVVSGDLGAQIAACRTGAKRYLALCEKYGAETVRRAMELVFDRSEAHVRGAPRRISITTASTKTNPVGSGSPSASRAMAWKWTLPAPARRRRGRSTSLSPEREPADEGHSRPLRVTSPEHTLTNPSWPAPCDSYGYAALVIIDLVSEALSNAAPDRCPAGEFMLFGAFMFRTDPRHGKPFICIDPCDGGGALPFADGADGLIFHGDGDVPNLPALLGGLCVRLFVPKTGMGWDNLANVLGGLMLGGLLGLAAGGVLVFFLDVRRPFMTAPAAVLSYPALPVRPEAVGPPEDRG